MCAHQFASLRHNSHNILSNGYIVSLKMWHLNKTMIRQLIFFRNLIECEKQNGALRGRRRRSRRSGRKERQMSSTERKAKRHDTKWNQKQPPQRKTILSGSMLLFSICWDASQYWTNNILPHISISKINTHKNLNSISVDRSKALRAAQVRCEH